MDSRQKRIVMGVFVIVLLAWLAGSLLFSAREHALILSLEPLAFDATRARQTAAEFVTENPGRVLGSLESRQSTAYLYEKLTESGYEIEYTHFDARIGGRSQAGRNVLAFRQGESSEILAVTAHYDTAETTHQGAMKNGAAVGVLLELARVFRATPTQRSLLFIFTDGGEWGSLGARDMAAGESHQYDIAAVLSLEGVGIGDLAAFRLEKTGQLEGFTPPWLRQLALRAAETQNLPVQAPSGFKEHLERTWSISRGDQGPFLAAGIPAITLGSVSSDRAREKAIFHSPEDTIENITVDSMEMFGFAAERIIRSLDTLPSIPRESANAFRIGDSRFTAPATMQALHILSFLPLPVFFILLLLRHGTQVHFDQIGRELLLCSLTFLPLLTAYFCLQISIAMRLFPLYTLYPPIANHPAIENPSWGIVWAIVGTALFVAVICWLIGRFGLKSWPTPCYDSSKLVLLGLMLIMVFFAIRHNSYWAMTFLLLPAWMWTVVGSAQTPGRRSINRILILAAAAPGLIGLSWFASSLGLQLNYVWYHILALTTGLFSTTGYFIGAAAVAIGIRWIAIQGHRGGRQNVSLR
jgi:hypothetical protein